MTGEIVGNFRSAYSRVQEQIQVEGATIGSYIDERPESVIV